MREHSDVAARAPCGACAVSGACLAGVVTLLADVTSGELPWGKLRFGAATGDDPTTGALFRDFVVTSRQAAP